LGAIGSRPRRFRITRADDHPEETDDGGTNNGAAGGADDVDRSAQTERMADASVACDLECDENSECVAGACVCKDGFAGDGVKCRMTCALSPCFAGVECTDDKTEGFDCGECPLNYWGDGIDCYAVEGCAAEPCFDGVPCTPEPDQMPNYPVVLDAPELTFSTDDATLVFLDREVADPDVELTAGTWLIDSFIQGQGVTNYGFDTDPTIEFSEDGSFEFTTPCNSGSGGYEVNGDELIIGQASWTERGCVSESAREAESIMLETLGAGSGVSFEIDARRLWIRAGDVGFGAMLE
jgi:heat shock protein HslJ